MANTAGSTEAKLPENEKELLSEASRHAADVQAAMDSLEVHLRDAAKLVAAVERVNGVFTAVGDRIGNATFKASIDTTHGKSPREVAVSFVKELSELACMSLQGTRELRRELVNVKASASTVLPALRQAATAMQSLSGALRSLATRPNRTTWVKPPIIVETRTTLGPAAPRESIDEGGQSVSMGFFPASRTRRFSN